MPALVQIDAVSHRYGNRLALDSVSFSVDQGEVFGLLGPNGGGKTTLFRILTTCTRPDAGRATICKHDVVTQPGEVRRVIGVVVQHASLDGKLTVRENLLHQGHLYGLSGLPLADRIREMLERFGVADRMNDRVETLSGGLARRVDLAKGLLHRPKVLLLDGARSEGSLGGVAIPRRGSPERAIDGLDDDAFHGRGAAMRPGRHHRRRAVGCGGAAGRVEVRDFR